MPEWMIYVKEFFALVFVAGLIFLCAALAKKAGLDKHLTGSKGTSRRLEIVETLYLDQRHRLVIVRAGDNEHLLLLGASGDLLVESRKREPAHEV